MQPLQSNPTWGRWLPAPGPRRGPVFFLLAFVFVASLSRAADPPNVSDPPPAKLDTNAAADTVRSYLQLQEQLHSAQLAIERNRQEADAAATRNAEVIAARLQALEESLAAQRARERETAQEVIRLVLTVGGGSALAGFLVMLLTAYFQWRAVGRLTEFSVLSQASLTMGRGVLPAPGAVDLHHVNTAVSDQANARLFGSLDRLEKRILELEHTAHLPSEKKVLAAAPPSEDAATASKADRLAVLLAKGESLLSLDKTEEALRCYDQILALEPDHPEALVKKGDALERLRQIDDAIHCYDRAIAADDSLTVAYLHKGGLFNRLERYEEALKCYEQALQAQAKSHAA